MTLFFNLHRLGWKRTPMLRVTLPAAPRAIVFWQLVAALLLWAYVMLALALTDTRNTMADELVRARIKATEYELDVICLLRPECALRSWGEDGQYHSVTIRGVEVIHTAEPTNVYTQRNR